MTWYPSQPHGGADLIFDMFNATPGSKTFTFKVYGGLETVLEETFTIEVTPATGCSNDFDAPATQPSVWPNTVGSLLFNHQLSHDEANNRYIKLIDTNTVTIPLAQST